MKRIVTSVFFILSLINYEWAQDLYYLDEGFEDAATISEWSVSPFKVNKQWEYTYGGQWESGDVPYNPEIPYQGNYNAGLYYPSLTLDSIKLISPTLELAGSNKPTLRFYHCQYEKIFKGPDHLKMYFRSSPSANWDLIHSWTSDISYWKDEIFDIGSIGTKYLTDSFQIAFEGVIGNGYGVYLDSITVHEDAVVQKFVKRITYTPVDYQAIPAGATGIPLEQITIRVLGNTGVANLDSLVVVPTGTGANYFVTDSFKLFCTNNGELFAPFVADTSTLVAIASLNAGKVVFDNINRNLLLGDNNFWVAANFKNTVKGQVSLQFSVPAHGIRVNDTLLPVSTVNFNNTEIIKESVFYDNFESGAPGWSLGGNFEVGWPAGNLVGSQTNPSTPFNGTKILATDLNGGYLPNIDSTTAYYAYSPQVDLTYYINPGLYFQSFFAINGPDNGIVDYSIDGGTTWKNLWTSDPSSNNSYWSEFYDKTINKIASRQPQFQVRFGIDHSEATPWPGFSIDNFAIIAEKLYADVGVTEIPDPYDECLGCGNDTVKAWFRNFAVNNAPDTIPVFYGLWGVDSVIVRDTIFGGISKDDSVLFTFSKLADFPKGDFYDKFIVGVDLSGDQDPTNDTLTKSIVIQNYYTPPIFENFEYKGGIWLQKENSTWTNKDMTGTITTDPQSPHIWVLSYSGNYANNDTSYVESGCYDLSGESQNIVQFKYWSDCEATKDGARFEYTRDNGATWNILKDPVYDSLWNWTIDTVEALGSRGWTGINEWTTVKALVPEDADTAKKVKFRVLFMSDGANAQAQGFAFNDFRIYPAPIDIGASSIQMPSDACQYVNSDTVKVYVTNYGYNKLDVNDTVILGVDLIGQTTKIDTFKLTNVLLPGDSALFKVYTPMNIDSPGVYDLRAYTKIEADPWFYGTNNDSVTKTFTVWPNPLTLMPDTISSREPDTVVIRPHYDPNYNYLWNDLTTDSIYHVSAPGTYYLTVTGNTHGCQSYDSTFVQLLFNDVGIQSVQSPVSSCTLGNSEQVAVWIKNFGTDSLIAGDKIRLAYQLDNGTIKKDSITLTQSFHAQSLMLHTFSSFSEDLSNIGDYSLKSWATCGGDTIPEDDTINSGITVFGNPVISLGNDTVVKALSYPLSVAPVFVSYLWNDGDTVNSKLVETSGMYSLHVVDTNGCSASDTVSVWLKIRDISAIAMLSPVSECNRLGTDQVIMKIKNTGTDTLTNSDNINFSYTLNAGSPVNGSLSINQLIPGDTYNYTFSSGVDLTSVGTYDFHLTAQTAGDLVAANNSTDSSVYTNSNPVVHLDVDPQAVYKVTEKVLDAGTGPNWSYLWQDGSTDQTYTATNSLQAKVLVTDTLTGCYGGDTVYVNLDILDYTITSVGINATTCSGLYKNVTVGILNNGNLPRASANILLTYKLDDVTLFTETYTENRNWPQGLTRTWNTQDSIDLSGIGTKQLKVTATQAGDLRPENDTYSKTVQVIQSPVVNFGGDTIKVKLPHTLDAGSGQQSYLWSDNSTNTTLTVNTPGSYSVSVTGSNGCETAKSVYVAVGTYISPVAAEQMKVNIFPNPASDYITVDAEFEHPGTYRIEIYNGQNSLLYKDEIRAAKYSGQIYVGNLLPGMYILKISNSEMFHVSKLIVR